MTGTPASLVPIIDCSMLRTDPADPALTEQIEQACRVFGGFVASGCELTATGEAFRQARRFFELPEEARRAVAADHNNRGWTEHRSETSHGREPDVKEAFQVGRDLGSEHPLVRAGVALHGPNRWPELPGFQVGVEALFEQIQGLCLALSVPLARGLGLDSAGLCNHLAEPYTSMRLHRYRTVEPETPRTGEEFGHAPHTDFGLLGIVVQEEGGGLQAEHGGEWVDVPGGGDLITVIVGDLLAWWSGGRYRALRHQVPTPRQRDRYSIAAFMNPAFNRSLHPLNNAEAQPQRCGKFILDAAHGAKTAPVSENG
ncbi:2-oxoglutarate and iron-dependent oxygenase domain-containing protein [Saccharopolyspora sp. NPDC000995]